MQGAKVRNWAFRILRIGALAATAALAACGTLDNQASREPAPQPVPTAPAPGVTRIALILPLSATNSGATAAASIRNAAEMAVAEFGAGAIELVVKDDLGTPAGAAAAAESAASEGAQIILGPLFASSVAAVRPVARSRALPVIAFSSDANAAAEGVYLLSFMPQSDVDRIVSFAAQSGKRSFAALIPETAYGTVVEGSFQQAVARVGARVASLERVPVDPAAITAAASRIAQLAASGQADVIFTPFDAASMALVSKALAARGVSGATTTILGTGIWDDPRIFADATLAGAFYAAPDSTGFRAFSDRYRARYQSDPVRLATVGYDAVSLVKALVKTQGPNAFAPATLQMPSGFVGVDGSFRFLADGSNQRSLAVMKVAPSGPQTVAPAVRGFGS